MQTDNRSLAALRPRRVRCGHHCGLNSRHAPPQRIAAAQKGTAREDALTVLSGLGQINRAVIALIGGWD